MQQRQKWFLFLVILVGGTCGAWWYHFRYETLIAGAGKPLFLYLPDGTSVALAPGGHVRYALFPTLSEMEVNGELLVEVSQIRSDSLRIFSGNLQTRLAPGQSLWCRSGADSCHLYATTRTALWVLLPSGPLLLPPETHLRYSYGTRQASTWQEPLGNRLAWANRRLLFERAPLPRVLQDLEAFFNLPFRHTASQLDSLTFSGAFQDPTPQEVLDVLTVSLPVTYRRVGRGYRIEPTP